MNDLTYREDPEAKAKRERESEARRERRRKRKTRRNRRKISKNNRRRPKPSEAPPVVHNSAVDNKADSVGFAAAEQG